jgi:hypothetical protein
MLLGRSINEDKIDGTCRTHGEDEIIYKILVGEPEEKKKSRERRMRRWEGNTKTFLK